MQHEGYRAGHQPWGFERGAASGGRPAAAGRPSPLSQPFAPSGGGGGSSGGGAPAEQSWMERLKGFGAAFTRQRRQADG